MIESDLQKSVIQYLTIKHIFHYRQNSGAIVTERKGKKGFYRFTSMNGLPDIVCVYRGQYVGLEMKSNKGKLSENQIMFREKLEQAGGKYIEVRDLDTIIKLFP